MFGQGVEYVDMPVLADRISKAQCGVTKAAAGIDHVIALRRLDFHSAAIEIILSVQECPGDVFFPALDPDIVSLYPGPERSRAGRTPRSHWYPPRASFPQSRGMRDFSRC